jgi:alpha-D-ribose 1-methylphosphonate 5-triphosphate synthase subunit PhnG
MTVRFATADALKIARQEWLSVLVRVPAEALIESAGQFGFEVFELKAPEVGMLMTDARIHASGPGFHLGEVTLTRCVLKDELGHLGYGQILGRNTDQALAIARFDLALQRQDTAPQAEEAVSVWREEIQSLDAMQSERVDATRVNFFTMVRGDG